MGVYLSLRRGMESGSVLVIEKGEWENGAYLSLRRGIESGSLLVIEKA